MTAAPAQQGARRQSGGCLLFLAGVVLGLPLLVALGFTLTGPPSIEMGLITLSALLFVIASLVAPWRNTRALVLTSLLLGLGVLGYRYVAAAAGETVHTSVGPHGGEGRVIDRIVPERDVALGGTALLMAAGAMPVDQPGLRDALRDGYSRMALAEGAVPSAIVGTFSFGQQPDAHSLLRVAPPRFEPPKSAVIFLHGYMGNLTLACWQFAQGANPVGLDVLCPSTGWAGRWAEPDGRRTVEATIAALRGQGVRRIYLAGLSNGAIGTSLLAPELDVDGVILISGASAQARPSGKPTLVLQGALDRMTPPAPARAYARRANGTYEEHPEAGHWLILSHHEWIVQHLRRWIAEQEGLSGIRSTE